MDEQKIKDRLRKLYELAVRGVDGEATTARAILDRLLSQHDLTLADIADEKRDYVKLTWKDKEERSIVIQVLYRLLNTDSFYVYEERARSFEVKLTKSEAVQAKEECAALLAGYRKERKRLLRAFVHRNQLYAEGDDKPAKPMTDEELNELMEALRMAESMTATPIHRMIVGN